MGDMLSYVPSVGGFLELSIGLFLGFVLVVFLQGVTLYLISNFYFSDNETDFKKSDGENKTSSDTHVQPKLEISLEPFSLNCLWEAVQDPDNRNVKLGEPESNEHFSAALRRLIQHLGRNEAFRTLMSTTLAANLVRLKLFGLKVIEKTEVKGGNCEIEKLHFYDIQTIENGDDQNCAIVGTVRYTGQSSALFQLVTVLGIEVHCQIELHYICARVLVNFGATTTTGALVSTPELRVSVSAVLDGKTGTKLPLYIHGALCLWIERTLVLPNQMQIPRDDESIESPFRRHSFKLTFPEVGARYAAIRENPHMFEKTSAKISYCEVCGATVKSTPIRCQTCSLIIHAKCEGKRTIQCLDIPMQASRLGKIRQKRRYSDLQTCLSSRDKFGSSSLTFANSTGGKLTRDYYLGTVKLEVTITRSRSEYNMVRTDNEREKDKNRAWFCLLSMGQLTHKTARMTMNEKLEVEWNETVSFTYSTEELPQVVRCTVFEYDTFGKDVFLGSVFVDVCEVIPNIYQRASFTARGSGAKQTSFSMPTIDFGFLAIMSSEGTGETENEPSDTYTHTNSVQNVYNEGSHILADVSGGETATINADDSEHIQSRSIQENNTHHRLHGVPHRLMKKALSFTPSSGGGIFKSRPYTPTGYQQDRHADAASIISKRVFQNSYSLTFSALEPVLFESICFSVDTFSGMQRRLYRFIHYFMKPVLGTREKLKHSITQLMVICESMGDVAEVYMRGLFSIGLVSSPTDKKNIYDKTYIEALTRMEAFVKNVSVYAYNSLETYRQVSDALKFPKIVQRYDDSRTVLSVRIQNTEMMKVLVQTPLMQIGDADKIESDLTERLDINALFECVVQIRDILSKARVWSSMDAKGMAFAKSISVLLDNLHIFIDTHGQLLEDIYVHNADRNSSYLALEQFKQIPKPTLTMPHKLIETYSVTLNGEEEANMWLYDWFFCITKGQMFNELQEVQRHIIEPRYYTDVVISETATAGAFYDCGYSIELKTASEPSNPDLTPVKMRIQYENDVVGSLCYSLFATRRAIQSRDVLQDKYTTSTNDTIPLPSATEQGYEELLGKKVHGIMSHFKGGTLGKAMITDAPPSYNAYLTLSSGDETRTKEFSHAGKGSVTISNLSVDVVYRATSKITKRKKSIMYNSIISISLSAENNRKLTVVYKDQAQEETLTVMFVDKVASQCYNDIKKGQSKLNPRPIQENVVPPPSSPTLPIEDDLTVQTSDACRSQWTSKMLKSGEEQRTNFPNVYPAESTRTDTRLHPHTRADTPTSIPTISIGTEKHTNTETIVGIVENCVENIDNTDTAVTGSTTTPTYTEINSNTDIHPFANTNENTCSDPTISIPT
eukprot:CFRG8618T1